MIDMHYLTTETLELILTLEPSVKSWISTPETNLEFVQDKIFVNSKGYNDIGVQKEGTRRSNYPPLAS